jgi:hypothetical protein
MCPTGKRIAMRKVPPFAVLVRLPHLSATKGIPCPEKTIHLHFSLGPCHWYAAEFDGGDIFFGFVDLGDPAIAEWGYFTLSELAGAAASPEPEGDPAALVEWDEGWTPMPFREIV